MKISCPALGNAPCLEDPDGRCYHCGRSILNQTSKRGEKLKRQWNDFCELGFPSKHEALNWWLIKFQEELSLLEMEVEAMKIGNNKVKRDLLEDKLPGGWGCCGEEVIGYDVALSEVLSLHSQHKEELLDN